MNAPPYVEKYMTSSASQPAGGESTSSRPKEMHCLRAISQAVPDDL